MSPDGSDGWMGWMGYLQTSPFLDHLAVIKTSDLVEDGFPKGEIFRCMDMVLTMYNRYSTLDNV